MALGPLNYFLWEMMLMDGLYTKELILQEFDWTPASRSNLLYLHSHKRIP